MNKQTYWGIGIAAAIVLIAGYMWYVAYPLGIARQSSEGVAFPASETSVSSAPVATSSSQTSSSGTRGETSGGISGGTDSVATSSDVDYQDAKNTFDYRFQFDSNCNGLAGLPGFGSLNVKQGAALMLENHGTTEHVLAVGNDAHRVKAGDFIVAYAPKISKPTGLFVTCDGKGAGTLYVYP